MQKTQAFQEAYSKGRKQMSKPTITVQGAIAAQRRNIQDGGEKTKAF